MKSVSVGNVWFVRLSLRHTSQAIQQNAATTTKMCPKREEWAW